MQRLLAILILMFIPVVVFAQQNAGDVAHGAEKQAHEVAHPTESHGEEGEAPKTYFGIPGWVLKLLNMILFIGVLVYFVGGPIKKAIADRGDAIRRASEEARERRVKADQMAADIQKRLAALDGEVKAIHDRAKAEGEKQKREMIAAAEAEAQKILATARMEVDNRVKQARAQLTEYAGQLAAERAEAILREKITADDQHRLFKESLHEVDEVRS